MFRDLDRLEGFRSLTRLVWDSVDVIVLPTVPRVPTIAEVQADPFGVNSMLGTYTNFVNLLDLAAITVPVGPSSEAGPPLSLTLIGPAWSDDLLISLAGSLR